jgi:hypothetical protein
MKCAGAIVGLALALAIQVESSEIKVISTPKMNMRGTRNESI